MYWFSRRWGSEVKEIILAGQARSKAAGCRAPPGGGSPAILQPVRSSADVLHHANRGQFKYQRLPNVMGHQPAKHQRETVFGQRISIEFAARRMQLIPVALHAAMVR